MTPRPADAADAFGYGYARQRFAHELLKNAQRSTMVELIARGDEEFRLELSIRRRNAMIRLFLARWGAIEAMRALKDPVPSQPIRMRRWRDRDLP
jgi:hypothetical protein